MDSPNYMHLVPHSSTLGEAENEHISFFKQALDAIYDDDYDGMDVADLMAFNVTGEGEFDFFDATIVTENGEFDGLHFTFFDNVMSAAKGLMNALTVNQESEEM